jgi:hypothetical protein
VVPPRKKINAYLSSSLIVLILIKPTPPCWGDVGVWLEFDGVSDDLQHELHIYVALGVGT